MINDGIRHWDADRGQYIVYADDYDQVVNRLAALQKAIDDHNACSKSACQWRRERGTCSAWTDRGMTCPDCLLGHVIEVPK